MPMVTRCPGCNTVFRVTPQQLQAHRGDVRCGRCMMVFNGFKGLTLLPDAAPAEPQVSAPGLAVDIPPAAAPAAPDAHSLSTSMPDSGSAELSPPESVSGTLVEPEELVAAAVSGPQIATPDARPEANAPDENSAAEETVAVDYGATAEALPPRRRSQGWAIGSAFLVLGLIGQATYLHRSELAANYPGLKPALTKMCGALGCIIPLPQRPKLIHIEASDMQAPDPAHPNRIQLTATLRNHAGYDVAYPALDLVLTNTMDHGLARRIFMPDEYIGHGRDVKRGIPASAEFTVHLDLDTGDLGAAGFRLDLLAAPAR